MMGEDLEGLIARLRSSNPPEGTVKALGCLLDALGSLTRETPQIDPGLESTLKRVASIGITPEELVRFLDGALGLYERTWATSLGDLLDPAKTNLGLTEALRLYVRHPNKDEIIYALLVKATMLYGFSQAVYFEFSPEKNEFTAYKAVGPATEAEHESVLARLSKLRGGTIADIVDKYDSRNDVLLNEKISGLSVKVTHNSLFYNMLDKGQSVHSFEGDRRLKPTVASENLLIEKFNTDKCAMIVVKGLGGDVIGFVYGNWNFTESPPPRIDRDRMNPYRYAAAAFLELYRMREEAERKD